MKKGATETLQKIVKYMIFAGVLASFVFIGWRIVTKGAYSERELAQCRALAVSAAIAACEALESPELSAHVREAGETLFIIDHMKMPGHNVVSVTMRPEGDGFEVLARAETNWNSRSPQNYEFAARRDAAGVSFPESGEAAENFHVPGSRGEELKRLTFTFPHEKKCPVPFDVIAEEIEEADKKPLVVLRLAR